MTHIGFSQVCDYNQNPTCSESEQVAVVRTITCASDGGRSCRKMFVGGYFNRALGEEMKGLVQLDTSDPNNVTVSAVTDDDDGDGVDGLVMAIEVSRMRLRLCDFAPLHA